MIGYEQGKCLWNDQCSFPEMAEMISIAVLFPWNDGRSLPAQVKIISAAAAEVTVQLPADSPTPIFPPPKNFDLSIIFVYLVCVGGKNLSNSMQQSGNSCQKIVIETLSVKVFWSAPKLGARFGEKKPARIFSCQHAGLGSPEFEIYVLNLCELCQA